MSQGSGGGGRSWQGATRHLRCEPLDRPSDGISQGQVPEWRAGQVDGDGPLEQPDSYPLQAEKGGHVQHGEALGVRLGKVRAGRPQQAQQVQHDVQLRARKAPNQARGRRTGEQRPFAHLCLDDGGLRVRVHGTEHAEGRRPATLVTGIRVRSLGQKVLGGLHQWQEMLTEPLGGGLVRERELPGGRAELGDGAGEMQRRHAPAAVAKQGRRC